MQLNRYRSIILVTMWFFISIFVQRERKRVYLTSSGIRSPNPSLMCCITAWWSHTFWNSKALRMCPCLCSHTFVTCLQTIAHDGLGSSITSLLKFSCCCTGALKYLQEENIRLQVSLPQLIQFRDNGKSATLLLMFASKLENGKKIIHLGFFPHPVTACASTLHDTATGDHSSDSRSKMKR